jgi:ribosomal protein L21
MYAVIKTGGKQYKVAAGEKIKVEQIAADVGQEIVIEQVLAVGNGAELQVGTPWVAGANVKATVAGAWQARQGAHLQDAPPQALPTARRSSPDLHRAADRFERGQRLKEH